MIDLSPKEHGRFTSSECRVGCVACRLWHPPLEEQSALSIQTESHSNRWRAFVESIRKLDVDGEMQRNLPPTLRQSR
jgi:hypothetical protein